MIGVHASQELRIQRVMNRSNMQRDEVLVRMAKQMDEEEKMRRCDYVIINNDRTALIPQVLKIDALLRQR
jgi:dephospho-CoA kinase